MLKISKVLCDEVIGHCRREYPKEACGFLIAGADGRITDIRPMRNVENSPIGYAMDPKEQLQVEKQLRQQQQTIVGIYHSHTASAAYPSSVDVGLAVSPDVSYLLVSLADRARPEVRSYRIGGSRITEEPVQVEGGSLPARQR